MKFPIRATLALAAVAATAAIAHDEDWRKLADIGPAHVGPIWRMGDEVDRNSAFDAQNIQLFSRIPTSNFPGSAGGNASDCWGYTSPTGREIAILGLSDGHGFVDITVPADPQVIGFIPSPSSVWHDIKVIGDYAYAVTEGGGGLQVIDLTQVDAGIVTLAGAFNLGGHTTTHNIVANPDSQHVYLCGANIGNGGLIAIDVSNPTAPVITGSFTPRYVHDAQVITYPATGFGAFSGREIAYCFSETQIDIVDVTNKSNMTLLASGFYPGTSYTHQGWLSEDLQYLYVNDELDEQNQGIPTTTRVFRVWDPTGTAAPDNPIFLGTFGSGTAAIDHNLYVHDNLIYQANYRSGLRVFDAAIPDSPVEVAYFDTFNGSDAAAFNGAWNVFPYFPSGNVIVSDIEQGLFVFSVENPQVERLLIRLDQPLPETINPGIPVTLTARVDEQNVTLDPATVTLTVFDSSDQIIANTPMTALGNGLYEAQLPALGCGESLTTRISADSTDGFTYFSVDAATRAVPAFNVTLTDSADTNQGFTVSGNAAAGAWGLGVPVGDRGGPGVDADGSGSAWLTGPGAGNTDVDGGSTILTSPIYDLSEPGEISLSYWYGTVSNGVPDAGDGLLFQVSTDGGGTWSSAFGESVVRSSWNQLSLVFSETGDALPSANARFRVIATDINNGSVVEAAIDGIEIRIYDCPSACGPADITTTNTNPGDASYGSPDGAVDGADISFFVEAWLADNLAVADLTTTNTNPGDAGYASPDSVIDGADLSFYVELWLAGCP